jgi:outer membrane protein assembly factor BamE
MKKLIILITICCGLIGCAYRPDVQQGNILDPAKIQQLKLNMSKEQVCSILGDPVLDNAFNKNYWTYTYTKQKNGGIIHVKQLILQFKNDQLIKINGKTPPALVKGPIHF